MGMGTLKLGRLLSPEVEFTILYFEGPIKSTYLSGQRTI